ncbi:phosphatase PAP2 family protein [Vagococcus fluvialis]|uniref:phosphatase PAP2 family protein n=1 Tax=Vagococcus fluvialis TaxID=2738 RepID=UPI003B598A55
MRKEVKLFLGVFTILLVVLTVFDLQISEALYNPESTFGWFFESFGELVLSFIGLFSASVLFRTQQTRKVPMKILFAILGVFNGLMAAMLNKMYLNLSTVVMILLMIVYIAIFYFLASLVKPEKEQVVRKIAKIGICLSLLPILIITVLKMIWGRQRFRSMTDPSNQFTPWYLMQTFTSDNEFMSFPSGHSANSATVIWITLLPLWIEKLKPYRRLLVVAAYGWIVCVMLSRIIMGAHFSTDVLIGSSITLGLFYYLQSVYLRDELISL